MSAGLPALIEPFRCADRGARFQGTIPLARLSRLGESLLDREGSAALDLAFGRDERGRAVVTGRVAAEVRLRCQRCLEPVVMAIEAPVRLAVVASDAEAERLPEELDPLLVEAQLSLAQLVEDELILALPLIPAHGQQGCPNALVEPYRVAADPEAAEPARQSPFAVLARLADRDDEET